jgi:hypothetical protein
VPIPRENWIPRPHIKFDEFLLLGLPEETTIKIEGEGFMPRPVILPLHGLDAPPPGYETPYPRFCAKIFDNVTIKSIVGMSGGPIFGIGITSDGKKRYWTVAIQSAWLPSERIIFGCPIPVFMRLMDEAVAYFRVHPEEFEPITV